MSESHNRPLSGDELREMFERFQGPDTPSPQPRRSRRRSLGLSLGLAALLLVGIAVVSIVINGDLKSRAQTTIFSGTAGMCASSVNFDGRHYYGNKEDSPQRGERLGAGVIPSCDDSIATELSSDGKTITTYTTVTTADQSVDVYSVIGVNPTDAVMIDDDIDTVYYSESTSKRLKDTGCWSAGDYLAVLDCLKSSS